MNNLKIGIDSDAHFMATAPRVFVPHEPCRWDAMGKNLVPIYDLQPAEKYGLLTAVLDRGAITLTVPQIIERLRDVLYGFSDKDSIICVGDPVIIALAMSVAADENFGRVRMLRYDRTAKIYNPVEVDLGE